MILETKVSGLGAAVGGDEALIHTLADLTARCDNPVTTERGPFDLED